MVSQFNRNPDLSPKEAKFLREFLSRQGLPGLEALHALHGGRTSRVWKVVSAARTPLIAKLSRQIDSTEMFPNAPDQEWRALIKLCANGVAPAPVAFASNGAVGSVLLLHAADRDAAPDASNLARLLLRIHRIEPWDDLPRLPMTPDAILQDGNAMLRQAGATAWLSGMRPKPPLLPITLDARLIHRDLVPANTAVVDGRHVAIDWQCPSIGDPAEDLAHASSPAMQSLAKGVPRIAARDLVAAYPDRDVRARFRQMEPLYRWRMACYCHLQASRGAAAYEQAVTLECEALEQACRQAHR
ncbi:MULTISPECIES: phosphotransferase family protein [Dinoroseobacter]|jgi:hypothetical protein|uniref:phosphotransferase family protein n=1 Tax=Dinoroseobacter TaxID=309512 RepID=UPI00237A0E86|nr:aminoglycoside phosphotransferase family protein [Dinoroseobacter sp. PD6]MDD9718180.1 aminoglycoside phosphotransferase family protein [Dinoroseobacter sp. PD6]